jgi:hypothetical protein
LSNVPPWVGYVHQPFPPSPHVSDTTSTRKEKREMKSLHLCHTWFSKENQMHLICAPGSSFLTYDRCHEWNINKQQ